MATDYREQENLQCGSRASTPAEDAEHRFKQHTYEADKASRAAKFFQLHPEFSEFIELVRNGSIGI